MPIYEFQCGDCSTVFEMLTLSSASGSIAVCPKCKSNNTKKILSAGSSKASHGVSSTPPPGLSSGCSPRGGFS